ncbi:MAG: hypothetical protein Q9225_007762 [Loekoesia sp. 1 TL-2023]
MRYGQILVLGALASAGVSGFPAPGPNVNTAVKDAPALPLTVRNVERLNGKTIQARTYGSQKSSKKSQRKRSSKSGSSGKYHYRSIRAPTLTTRALKKPDLKYFKVRSARPWDTGSYKSSKSSKSGKSSKSVTSSKSGYHHRRDMKARDAEPKPSSNDLVLRWLDLDPREAQPTYPLPDNASHSGESSKSGKSSNSSKSSKSGKSGYPWVRRWVA